MAESLRLLHTFAPGQRVTATTRGGQPRNLGLGTHLWGGEILLDSGSKVQADQCEAAEAEHCPVPPFEITLHKPAQVYQVDEGVLRMTRHWLHDGERLRVLAVETKPWNHGRYVVGKILYRGTECWLVLSQVTLRHPT